MTNKQLFYIIHTKLGQALNRMCHGKTGRLAFYQMHLPHKIRANVLMYMSQHITCHLKIVT